MEKKENIGLYFGSFNPIHFGHLILANHIVQTTDLDKIWFVVSPQNPLKSKNILIDNNVRLNLVNLAIEGNENFFVSDVEFSLPKPSYTINTLQVLKTRYPDKEFSLIIGEDNLCSFHKWKDYEKIMDLYNIYVYPREESEYTPLIEHSHVHMVDAPLINISSSYIRKLIEQGMDIRYLLPDNVREMIERDKLYRK
ncbi:MAG: nicotinate-nucleotide adenylyltransferase [Bacteroidales bacterium]|nr:nicotinate-nucleotide adenylyltransferase [Candidatus Scybalousia scybalohippi]